MNFNSKTNNFNDLTFQFFFDEHNFYSYAGAILGDSPDEKIHCQLTTPNFISIMYFHEFNHSTIYCYMQTDQWDTRTQVSVELENCDLASSILNTPIERYK